MFYKIIIAVLKAVNDVIYVINNTTGSNKSIVSKQPFDWSRIVAQVLQHFNNVLFINISVT